jgi:hypothetical protein
VSSEIGDHHSGDQAGAQITRDQVDRRAALRLLARREQQRVKRQQVADSAQRRREGQPGADRRQPRRPRAG